MDAHLFKEGEVAQGYEVQASIGAEVDAGSTVNSESQKKEEELENVKRRLKEIEEEASNLRAKFEIEESEQGGQDLAAATATLAEKEEADSRSIFVGNVDYECIPEEVQQHFQSCGTVNRVTIMNDGFGHPKGFAYVEFVETEAVQNALVLNDTELRGRTIKVLPKRTNLPGMTQYRGRRFTRRPLNSGPPIFPSYGYGRFPRFKPSMRYTPY